MRFDKLGRRLRVGALAAGLALVGGGGGYAVARLRPRRASRAFAERARWPGTQEGGCRA